MFLAAIMSWNKRFVFIADISTDNRGRLATHFASFSVLIYSFGLNGSKLDLFLSVCVFETEGQKQPSTTDLGGKQRDYAAGCIK